MIGILTRRFGYNLGSSLQAYAMSRIIQQLGHDVEIMDYDESSAHFTWKLRPLLEHFQMKHNRFLGENKRRYLSVRKQQEEKFADFEEQYLPLSAKRLSSAVALRRQSHKYDRIVVGSDQIWSPFLFDANYFGAFLSNDERGKMIAYAPSLGTSSVAEISNRQVELMGLLNAVSCREDAGADLIFKLTGKTVPVVLDPTLMVEPYEWDRIASNHKVDNLPEKYLLTYFLGKNVCQDAIDALASEHDAKIVCISMFNKPNIISGYYKEITEIGPAEFLYLIKNAAYVATDSYHATIFSWIFNKRFTVFKRFKEEARQNQNSRIHTLLSVLGCECNLYGTGKPKTSGFYDSIRTKSWSFLADNLK